MRVRNKAGHSQRSEVSIEGEKHLEKNNEDFGANQKVSLKRKVSSSSIKQAVEVNNEEKESNSQEEPLWGTIANENDSSDDDQDEADTDSENDEPELDSEGELSNEGENENEAENESDELSFEEDSESEQSDSEGEPASESGTPWSSKSKIDGWGKFTRTFYNMTSISPSSKISPQKSSEIIGNKSNKTNQSNVEFGDEVVSDISSKKGKNKKNKKLEHTENKELSKEVIKSIDEEENQTSVEKGKTLDEILKSVKSSSDNGHNSQESEDVGSDSLLPETSYTLVKTKRSVLRKESKSTENETSILDEIRKRLGPKEDEYEHDTSDEEDIRNTVGNIPMKWYDDQEHIGYDWDGKRIVKPPSGDEIDNFLKKMEDPNFWRTVKDPQTGEDVVLCDDDVELIARLQKNRIPDSTYEAYAPWIEWFSSKVMEMPLRKFPEHKRSFIPSKDEARRVGKMVHSIKMGWMKPKEEKPKQQQFYMLWETDDSAEHMRRIHNHIPAPKRHLPIHAESYNPPPEYLFDKIELQQWKGLKKTPWKRKVHYVPRKYSSLRHVPFYDNYVRERFTRCLDLYLCPRARKMRLLIQPEDLVPQLPSPKDLQPFPTTLALVYKGHTDMVRCITVEPKGQYLASGSDDLTVKIWEVATGRCLRTIPAGGIVRSISWCPNTALSLLAVAADRKLFLINPGVGDFLIVKKTDSLLEEAPEQDVLVSERVNAVAQWEQATGKEWDKGVRIIINHFKEIKQVTWHGRGDYFATVMPEAQNRSVLIHQVSKRRSQIPFNRSKGLVQCVLFHPIKPMFFVATQKNVRVYDLVKQEIVKKLLSNSKWISTMAIHPGGDNLLVGTYDRKMLWFDLDLSAKPYQTLRLHSCAVRGTAFHRRYPLFASGSDDNSVIASHGMVYNDLLQNPLIVPLKRMSYHEKVNDFSVFEVFFHPSQPWLFSSGADGTVRLYT